MEWQQEVVVPQAPSLFLPLPWVSCSGVPLPGGPLSAVRALIFHFLLWSVIWSPAAPRTWDSMSKVSGLLDCGALYK